MLNRKLFPVTVALCLMGLARLAIAQQNSSDQPFRPFGGFFAGLFDDGGQPPPKTQPPRQVQHGNYDFVGTPPPLPTPTRAPQPSPYTVPPSAAELPAPPPLRSTSNSLPAPPTTSSPRPMSSVTGKSYSFQYDVCRP